MTSIERTAYPQFRRLTSARVLHVFFTPSEDEAAWARERTETPESLLALLVDLKCFQRMARRGGHVSQEQAPRFSQMTGCARPAGSPVGNPVCPGSLSQKTSQNLRTSTRHFCDAGGMDLTPDQAASVVECHECPTCDAPPGSPCRIRAGKTAAKYHTPRFIRVLVLRENLDVLVPAPAARPELACAASKLIAWCLTWVHKITYAAW